MAAALSELLKAVDEYMKTNGNVGQKSSAYLASKFNAIFEDKFSPFNTSRNGVLFDLTKKIAQFSTKIENLGEDSGVVSEFSKVMFSVNIDLHKMKNKIKDTTKAFDKVLKNLNSFALNPMKFPTINATTQTSAVGIVKTVKFFLEKLQKDFSSTFTVKGGRRKGEKRVYAIDVNLVHVKESVFDRFFQQMQRRFSSEAITSKPDIHGKTHDIHGIDVNLQHINPVLMESLRKLLGKKSESDRPTRNRKSGEESGGMISKLFTWMKNLTYFFGGLFLIGKAGELLDRTVLGKTIKNIALNLLGTIMTPIKQYLKSGKFGTLMGDGVKIVSDTIVSIFSFFTNLYRKHKNTIEKNLQPFIKSIFDNLIYPLGREFNKFVTKTDWGGILKNIGVFFWDYIINPFFQSIASDFKNGDYMGIASKSVIAIIAASLVPGFGLLTKSLSLLTGVIPGLISAIGAIPINPLTITLAALGASFVALSIATSNVKKEIDKNTELSKSQSIANSKKKNNIKDKLKDLSDRPDLSYREKTEKRILEMELSAMEEHRRYEQSKSLVLQENAGVLDTTMNFFTGKVDKKLSQIAEDYHQKVYARDATLNSLRKEVDNMKSNDPSKWFNQTQKDRDEFVENFSSKIRPEKKKVNDAVIVEPHSKDQIIMGKNGGPFDMALKDMVKKIDEEMDVLRQGFDLLIQATLQGSGTVAQAVVATASTQSSSSGRTPGHDFRQHAKNMIR